MEGSDRSASNRWRVIVVGGHTRSIGKTQLVCDLLRALQETNWIAGKITQYGHGVCARNGEDCDCAPAEHAAALDWEIRNDSGTDTARFLAAGAKRALWLRTKQGFLAEGLPLLRAALREAAQPADDQPGHLLLESNSLLQFCKPTLYLSVLAPELQDFKDSAQLVLDRADAFILRSTLNAGAESPRGGMAPWNNVSGRLIRAKPCFGQSLGDPLPGPLVDFVRERLGGSLGAEL